MKSHVTTCHYSLFLYKNAWVFMAHDSRRKKKQKKKTLLLSLEFRRPCAIHKNLLTKKKKKKTCCVSDSLCTWVRQYMLPFIMLHKHICGAKGMRSQTTFWAFTVKSAKAIRARSLFFFLFFGLSLLDQQVDGCDKQQNNEDFSLKNSSHQWL